MGNFIFCFSFLTIYCMGNLYFHSTDIMKTIILYSLLLLSFNALAQTRDSFNVHFDFNKYDLTSEAKARLDQFIQEEQTTKNVTAIELDGHCDFIGNDAYNDNLSKQRVTAVKNYLLKNNFAENIFTSVKGHGKREPLNSNATDEERLLNRRVEIIITKKSIVKNEVPAAPKAPQPEKKLSEQIADTATKAGSNLVLKNINFVGARHQLLPESFPILIELLEAMKQNKNLKIEVQGHICCLPGNVDGVDEQTGTNNLSEERAKNIQQFLIKNGIEAERITYKGMGHSKPIYEYPEKTELEKTLNRRVEIKIISK